MRKRAIACVLAVVWTSTAHALVLCQKKAGVIVARDTCKKKETALSLSSLGVGVEGPAGPPGPSGPIGATGPQGPAGQAAEPGSAWAWANVSANGGVVVFSGEVDLSVEKPQTTTGIYCVSMPTHYGHNAAQVTLAEAGGTKFVSVNPGEDANCTRFSTPTRDVVTVYVKTAAGAAADGSFTIVIP
jgi:hypothetical protein